MKIMPMERKDVSKFIAEITSEGFITTLSEDFIERCGKEFLQKYSIKSVADEISVTLNFSYSDVIGRYLHQNYQVIGEVGESLSEEVKEDALDRFIDEVIELDSPFDHELISQDDELWDALKDCAKILKQVNQMK